MKTPFIDEHGFLRGFPYHDGKLEALVLAAGTASIAVRSTQGECHVIELHDLAGFSAEGVREGNIVLNMRLLEPARVAGYHELSRLVRERLQVEPATISGGRQMFFYLECSIGAEVLALCSNWSVVQGAFVLTKA